MKFSGRILTLAAALALAAAFPTIVHAQVSCGDTIYGDTTLTNHVRCEDITSGVVNKTALTVGADGVTIDLAGYAMKCIGQYGAPQHCQALGWVGINTNGYSNVTIKNGTVEDFAVGIHVNGGGNVTVRDLTVTGPSWNPVVYVDRAQATAILVQGVACREGALIDGNTVNNHRFGIKVVASRCVKVQRNTVTENDGAGTESHGILLLNSSGNTITTNFVNDNGAEVAGCGGITLAGTSSDNRVARNTALRNCGDGISARDTADSNTISGNSARSNPPGQFSQCSSLTGYFDLADNSSGVNNKWARTNDCWTEGGSVPTDVCNLGE